MVVIVSIVGLVVVFNAVIDPAAAAVVGW